MNVLAIEHEYYNTKKNLQEAKIREADLQRKIDYEASELNKSYILSDIDGYVTWSYNTKQGTNYISKGTSMVKVAPEREEKFYAKMIIPEESVKDVHAGQTAHIRVNAYNYYQYGILKSKISFVHRDSSNSFYALADIPN